ncbi:hypothetical protein CHS0354_038394 [Potamilus streckersoni]|uniref:Uncharacterized protein n=1 Tax=Potamilus streckersoni TaxID=2493646 RepID=A0AAE0S6E3_9BIVA|nr:hypothetical protein CHS0354_038394 [Potamilus streckersoni]
MSHERRRRNGKIGEYWKDNIEKWMYNLNKQRDEGSPLGIKSKRIQPSQDDEKDGRLSRPDRHGSQYSERGSGTDSTFSTAGYMSEPNFIYHPGFHGSMQYNKKKLPSNVPVGSESRLNVPNNSYGSLHDELEFQRRYKKVFDFNKHIHFVHSNFISGQNIKKRTKLPPLGHLDGQQQSDASEGMEILTAMSVQKYNHHRAGSNTGPVTSPVAPPSSRRNTDAFFGTGVLSVHGDETPQQLETPRDVKPTLSPVVETNRERDSLSSVSSRSVRKVYPLNKTTFEFQTNLDQNFGIYSYSQDGLGMDEKENLHPVIIEENEYNPEQMEYPTNRNTLQPLAVNGVNVNVIETECDVDMDRTVVDQDKILQETTDIMEDSKPFNISVHVEYKKKKSNPSHFITQLQSRSDNETLDETKAKKDKNENYQIIPEESEGPVENSRETTEATMLDGEGFSQKENITSLDRGDADDGEHNHVKNQVDSFLPKLSEPLTPREKPMPSMGHSMQEIKLPSISLRPFSTINGVEDK